MPLIKNGRIAEEDWAFVEGDTPLPDGKVTVTLERFKAEREALLGRNAPLGVRLLPEDDPHDLAEDLARLELVEVTFPKYVDGRGYSQAQLLRRRLGYKGELRAIGDVLRDQALLMVRSGFDALVLTNTDEAGFEAAVAEYAEIYQADAQGEATVFSKRHQGTSG